MSHDAVIVGAGPAGLTAGVELLKAGKKRVLIVEADDQVGGISRTVVHNGNRIDIGGHRFFSKSDWVMDWWRDILPVALPPGSSDDRSFRLAYQGAERLLGAAEATADESDENVMLVRSRLSRIYFGGKFYDYPLKPGLDTALKLGPWKCLTFGLSYAWSAMRPIKPEVTLQDFFINRFGVLLYRQFFKEYTEKVWGVPCNQISAAWGAQRVKSLSIVKLLKHAVLKLFGGGKAGAEQTSLIESFLYPKFGPGQMWEQAAERFRAMGGELRMRTAATRFIRDSGGHRVTHVELKDLASGSTDVVACENMVSTMPVKALVEGIEPPLAEDVRQIARDLEYRDFITVGVLYRKLDVKDGASKRKTNLPDNWIYIQEPGVKVGRVQIFNNWSPYMVKDPGTVWIGLEFFAREGDELWSMSDEQLKKLALDEMAQIKLASPADALDSVVLRMPKAYPGYYGAAYERFDDVRAALDEVENLYLVGRNGMHRYNNQDHSMLSAKAAVESIVAGSHDKSKLWAINVDDEYHEEADKASSR